VPLVSVSAANVSNLAFTRMSEITEGTPVVDVDENVRNSISIVIVLV
jgi:hypothetical protein